MTKPEFRERYGKDLSCTYWTHHNFATSTVVVAKEQRNFISYINESKEPNVELKKYSLWCKRDIGIGEELLLLYDAYYSRSYKL